jgi:hypothetical protein
VRLCAILACVVLTWLGGSAAALAQETSETEEATASRAEREAREVRRRAETLMGTQAANVETRSPSPSSRRSTSHVARMIDDDDAFRGIPWGASPGEVRANERMELLAEGENRLVYRGRAMMAKSFVIYEFEDDALVRGRYRFNVVHPRHRGHLRDFARVVRWMREKFGAPDERETVWSRETYRDRRSRWGMAVAVGHLEKRTVWHESDATITVRLTGSNHQIIHEVVYSSKN